MEQLLLEEDAKYLQARKFLMWLFVISSFMFFAALTSGFIIYATGSIDRGLKMRLPNIFIFSTGAIILSSLGVHLSYLSVKKMQVMKQRGYLMGTILLGGVFLLLQFIAWKTYIRQGVYLVSANASQSFFYVFTGAHLLHVIVGIAMIIYVVSASFKNIPQTRRLFHMEVTAIFWHFIDILWIYLYVFLLLAQ